MSWIQTFTGRKFDVLKPRAEDVCWVDIAHALAHQCRFNGHVTRFYSVAHHCVVASHHVPERFALYVLLHDAAEAYVGDMPKPVKGLFPEFSALEDRILAVVHEAAGLEPGHPYEAAQWVCGIDARMLLTEKQQLMGESPERWPVEESGVEPVDVLLSSEPDFEIFAGRYLRRLAELGVRVESLTAKTQRREGGRDEGLLGD
jgi:hypothetical protein